MGPLTDAAHAGPVSDAGPVKDAGPVSDAGSAPEATADSPVTLRWTGADALPPAARTALLGPGAPFELVEEDVLGVPTTVFARRPPHLRALLESAAARYGDAPYLVAGDVTLTFAQARDAVATYAAVLRSAHGVRPGDRVAIAAANSVEYVLAYWATLCLGAIAAGLNGWWTPAELADGVALAEPVVVLADAARSDRLADAQVAVPVVELTDLARAAAVHAGGPAGAGPDLPRDPIAEDDPAVLLFTSGTTGRPKAATLSHRNLVHFGLASGLGGAVAAVLDGSPPGPAAGAPQPAVIVVTPLFHISGTTPILVNAPAFGTRVVLPPPGRWDPATHLQLTAEHGVTQWTGVPTQLWRLLTHPDVDAYDLSGLRSVGAGGAVFAPELLRLLAAKLPEVRVTSGYGMSETTGTGTWLAGDVARRHPASVGAVTATVEVQVRGVAGEVPPAGEIGEIHIRGAGVFLGYWGDPAATADALDADRWYRSGDYGRITDGVLYLESRIRDMIVRGGENIYPVEIENRLVEQPDIAEAAVIGVDHPILGQEVKAFVVLRPGAALTAAEVREWTARTLAGYKVPAHVEFRADLPYNETGKVLKRQLERESAAG